MSVDVLRTQRKTEGSLNSDTVGYLNPVWYQLRQYSAGFSAVADLGGGLIRVTGNTVLVGERVRLSGTLYDGTQIGTVTATGVGTWDVTGITFKGTDSGVFINLTQHRNLHIETRLLNWAEAVVLSKAQSSWFGSPNMLVLVDLQSEIMSLAYKREAVDYSGINYLSKSVLQYRLQYREVWWNPAGVKQMTAFTSINENITASPTRKQIREKYGNNLLEYIMRESAQQFVNADFTGSLVPWLKTDPGTFDWEWVDYSGGSAMIFVLPTAGFSSILYQKVAPFSPVSFDIKFTGLADNVQFADSGMDVPTGWMNQPNGWHNWFYNADENWECPMSRAYIYTAELLNSDYVNIPAGRQFRFYFNMRAITGSGFLTSFFMDIQDNTTNAVRLHIDMMPYKDIVGVQTITTPPLPAGITEKVKITFGLTASDNMDLVLELQGFEVIQVPNQPIEFVIMGSNDGINWIGLQGYTGTTENLVTQWFPGGSIYPYIGFRAKGNAGNYANSIQVNYFKNAPTAGAPGKFLTRFKIPTLWRHIRVDQFRDPHFLDANTWVSTPGAGNPWTYNAANNYWTSFLTAGSNTNTLENQKSTTINVGTSILISIELFNLVGPNPNATINFVNGAVSLNWGVGKQYLIFSPAGQIGGKFFTAVLSGGGSSADIILHSLEVIQPTVPRPLTVIQDFTGGASNFLFVWSWLDINHKLIFSEVSNFGINIGEMRTFLLKNAPSGAHFVTIFVNNQSDTVNVVEPITLSIRDFCNPAVMIEWENSLGGIEQWVFQHRHNVTFQGATDMKPFEFYEADIENSQGNLGKNGTDRFFEMELIDEFVQTEDIPWLHELKISKQVRVIFPNGVAIFCIVTETTAPARTRATYTTFTVRIRLPRNFSPSLIDPTLFSGQRDPYKQIVP